ncbi:MAG: hypothetical protein JRE40_04310 [Deltaproteobacteria bacterium]|nr:hypothetical protein [Deltaproteobacteria bacterium]
MDSGRVAAYLDVNPVEALEAVWNDMDLTLAEKARLISRLHMKGRLMLEGTARIAGTSPAKVQALLDLAMLDDDDLKIVSDASPPMTTWFLFAGADSDAIRVGLQTLAEHEREEDTLIDVYDAMRTVAGPTLDERVAAIPGSVLSHLHNKAIQYGKLNDWQRKFLKGLAAQRKAGRALTEKQRGKLREVLIDLVQSGVVIRTSADDDQDECGIVLQALDL